MFDTTKYYWTYAVTHHAEGIAKAEIPEGHGAAHDLIFVSMLHGAEGGLSVKSFGVSAGGPPLQPIAFFTAWAVMALTLAETLPEGSWQQLVALAAHHSVRTAVLNCVKSADA